MNVYVTNRRDEEFEDGYAGVRYTFEPGKPTMIPIEAARHIFGYEDDNKEPYLVRLGWIKTRNDLKEGIKLLKLFEIKKEGPRDHDSLSPVVERVPLPVQSRAGGKPSLVA